LSIPLSPIWIGNAETMKCTWLDYVMVYSWWCIRLDGGFIERYIIIWSNNSSILTHLPFQPNKVANKVYSPVLAACYWQFLKCIKLLIEVQ
jgi:hypothetical protein